MREFSEFDFRQEPPSVVYDLTSRLVVPRPIALVSTLSSAGVANLAPFSYFNLGGLNPPSLSICVAAGASGDKDTLANIESSGEFVVNLVDRPMAESMNRTSAALAPDKDEWADTDFVPLESTCVAPRRVAQSPGQFECRLFQVVRHGNGPGSSGYVIGEILMAHIDLSALEPAFGPVARLGRSEYLDMSSLEVFSLQRPGG